MTGRRLYQIDYFEEATLLKKKKKSEKGVIP